MPLNCWWIASVRRLFDDQRNTLIEMPPKKWWPASMISSDE
jgi:hypothetical protein